jgi:hypothetical protein
MQSQSASYSSRLTRSRRAFQSGPQNLTNLRLHKTVAQSGKAGKPGLGKLPKSGELARLSNGLSRGYI